MTASSAPFDDYANNTIAYDDHGNTTDLAGQELVYDDADRHIATYTPSQSNP